MRVIRRTSPLMVLLAVVFLFPVSTAAGLDITTTFQLGNVGFPDTRPASSSTFAGADLLWGGNVFLVQDIADNFVVEGGVYRDLILRNVVYATLRYSTDYFQAGLGTFMGFLNSPTAPLNSGISATVRLDVPGVAYVMLVTDGSLGSTLTNAGDGTQGRSRLSLGIYVPNAICSLSMESREFIATDAGVVTTDSLTDYSFGIDIYQKNVPFRVSFDVTYESLERKYQDGLANPLHRLDSMLFGVGLNLRFGTGVTVFLNIDTSLYSWGGGTLAGVSLSGFTPFLFRGEAGFTLHFDNTREKTSETP